MSEKSCFVISAIGDIDSVERKRADDIFYYVLPEVVKPLGYKLDRADLIDSSGLISTQIIQHLKDDSLVIADLAFYNPNVFYELAIRHISKKPYIQLRFPNQKIPFDIANIRTIAIDNTDLKSIKEAQDKIKGHIEHMTELVANPISSALDELSLQGSTDPSKNVLGDIMRALSEIRGGLTETGKLTAKEELEIRQIVEEYIGSQLSQPLETLASSVASLSQKENILSLVKDDIQKIREAYQSLNKIYWSLIARRLNFYGRTGSLQAMEARREYQRVEMEKAMKRISPDNPYGVPKKNTE